jgi:hypothetical protein
MLVTQSAFWLRLVLLFAVAFVVVTRLLLVGHPAG